MTDLPERIVVWPWPAGDYKAELWRVVGVFADGRVCPMFDDWCMPLCLADTRAKAIASLWHIDSILTGAEYIDASTELNALDRVLDMPDPPRRAQDRYVELTRFIGSYGEGF